MDVWKALGDPTRREMLDELRVEPRTTGELCDRFAHLDRCTVMKHLDVLVSAHLVIAERVGRKRVNHLNPAPLQEIVLRWLTANSSRVATAALELKRRVEEKE
jgi:DNA-binding transcriptional ArsR family regulator